METPDIQVSVVHSGEAEPVILIHDADQHETTLLKMNLAAAQKLVEDLIGSIERVESLMAGPDEVSH